MVLTGEGCRQWYWLEKGVDNGTDWRRV